MKRNESAISIAYSNLALTAATTVLSAFISCVIFYPVDWYLTRAFGGDTCVRIEMLCGAIVGFLIGQSCFWVSFFRGHDIHAPLLRGRIRFGMLSLLVMTITAGLVLLLNFIPLSEVSAEQRGWPLNCLTLSTSPFNGSQTYSWLVPELLGNIFVFAGVVMLAGVSVERLFGGTPRPEHHDQESRSLDEPGDTFRRPAVVETVHLREKDTIAN